MDAVRRGCELSGVEITPLLKSALSTADPHLQALLEANDASSLVENNGRARRSTFRQALTIVENVAILIAPWQTSATAWQMYLRAKEKQNGGKESRTGLNLCPENC
jgi:hypothetical protein